MNNLKLSVPITFVCEELENAGIGSFKGKETAVQAVVDYIFRIAYTDYKEVNEMLWDPATAPVEKPCFVVGVDTHTKSVRLELAHRADSGEWVFPEGQPVSTVGFQIFAYLPYKISDETRERALALFHGTDIKSPF